jgi:hypothetical protein
VFSPVPEEGVAAAAAQLQTVVLAAMLTSAGAMCCGSVGTGDSQVTKLHCPRVRGRESYGLFVVGCSLTQMRCKGAVDGAEICPTFM